MMVDNIDEYLNNHNINKINIGLSGAEVYVVDNEYILKHTVQKNLNNPELFLSYEREALFYQSVHKNNLKCLPELYFIKDTDEEIILLMKKYHMIEHNEVKDEIVSRIMKAIAMVHQHQIPKFLLQNRSKGNTLSKEQINECVHGWKSVLNEHKGTFDEKPLDNIAKNINSVILWHDSEEIVLNHGDFHLNNLMIDEDENVVICDWQSVSTGGISNDLSFFLSRLNGDSIPINEGKVIELYSKAVSELYNKRVDEEEIYRHMCAATLITSFLFWHQYLHNTSMERVKGIYDKMVESALIL